ncbi:transcription termination/antitermination NusG family protein [Rhodoligotrophos defluvii]|uniref:transcription termination/antitermination NusG family protein n=1 Tax=Rhodoligotrophos defluvii TaxID=2561934 RepID=UPI00148569E5|nr:transcription termination/antitermination NusG family protein [Rhodoligotrophos defluvii]
MSVRETYRPYLRRETGWGLIEAAGAQLFHYATGETTLNLRWFAVETAPQREAFAYHNLLQRNVITFLPQRLRTVRHARRLQTEKVALFPGYIFVQLDLGQHRWRDINRIPGVRQILTSGGKPVPVKIGVIESLIESSDDHGIIYFMADARSAGRVRLVAGSCAAELGVLEDLDDHARVGFLLNLMNRQARRAAPATRAVRAY